MNAPLTLVAYIYMLSDPEDPMVCYVGCCARPKDRLYAHIWNGKAGNPTSGTRLTVWLRSLWDRRLEPRLAILAVVPIAEARIAEDDTIAMVRAVHGDGCLNSTKPSSYPGRALVTDWRQGLTDSCAAPRYLAGKP